MADKIINTVGLKCGTDLYVIRYETGSESVAIDALVEWVNNPAITFCWYDAALMSHQISQKLGLAGHKE